MGITEAILVVFVLFVSLGAPVSIGFGIYFFRRWLDYKTKLNAYGGAWQQAVQALDGNLRERRERRRLLVAFTYEGLPFELVFGDYVEVRAQVPRNLKIQLPEGGKVQALAQRVEWSAGCPSVRLGTEKPELLATTCASLAPWVRQALAEAARVDVGVGR